MFRREIPPPEIVDALAPLGLSQRQWNRAARFVARVTEDLPRCEALWIEALAATGGLSAFQAHEAHDGRVASLRVGPYVVEKPGTHVAWCKTYVARDLATRRRVCLALLHGASAASNSLASRETSGCSPTEQELPVSLPEGILPPLARGVDRDRVWEASPVETTKPLGNWLNRNGRLDPESVLEIARQTVASLAQLELLGQVHGGLGLDILAVSRRGHVSLAHVGLRARAAQGVAWNDRRSADEIDFLAPEQITENAPPSNSSDLFALGLVVWSLLCGRLPRSGGDSWIKLRQAQANELPSIEALAHDAPPQLAKLIATCTQPDPKRRPQSFAELSQSLGPSTRQGRRRLAQNILRGRRPWLERDHAPLSAAGPIAIGPIALAPTTVVVAVVALLLVAWSGMSRIATSALLAENPPAVSAQRSAPSTSTEANDQAANLALPEEPNRLVLPSETQPLANFDANSPMSTDTNDGRVPSVSLASAIESPSPETADYVWCNSHTLELTSAHYRSLAHLPLRAGIVVRPVPGKRAIVELHAAGWSIEAENVTIEGIDFVGTNTSVDASAEAPSALIEAGVSAIALRDCTFQAGPARDGAPATENPNSVAGPIAIRWLPPSNAMRLPAQLKLENCAARNLAALLDVPSRVPQAFQLQNVLVVETKAVWHARSLNELPTQRLVSLERVTLRDTGPLWEIGYAAGSLPDSSWTLQAVDCVFALRESLPLIRFRGPESPNRLWAKVRFRARNCVAPVEMPLLDWCDRNSPAVQASSDGTKIPGLIRAAFEFAEPSPDVDSCRVVSWQAPLLVESPPGIDESKLPVFPRWAGELPEHESWPTVP